MILFALHDYDQSKRGMFLINPADAKSWNDKGYGIHWLPQVFKDNIRKTENLIKIRFWLADIDTGDKEKMLKRIACAPLRPTFIVETKRGYHCYWSVKGDATAKNYPIIEKGIAEFLGADGSLITPTHTLRCPGYYHLKDPQNPFLIKTVWNEPQNAYSEDLMLRAFKPTPKIETRRRVFTSNEMLQEIIKPENWIKYLHTDRILQGGRNNELSRIAWKLKQMGGDESLIYQVLSDINQTINPPLDIREIRAIVKGKF